MDLVIADVAWAPLQVPLHTPFVIAPETTQVTGNWWVRVQLSDGTEGWGEAAPSPALMGETMAMTEAALMDAKHALIGQPARWRPIAQRLAEILGAARAARAALEVALLDALAQRTATPLWQWFGGANDQLETDVTVPIMPVDAAKAFAAQCVAKGFRKLKLKLSGDRDADEARIVAVHEVAPDAALQLDANQAYTPTAAWQLLRGLERRGIVPTLFEQPVPKDDWDGMRWLTRKSPVPICADEMVVTASDALRLVRENAAHAVNIKLAKSGVAESLRIVAIAQAARLQLMVGAMVETELGLTAAAHLAAGVGGFAFVDLDTHLFLHNSPFVAGFEQHGAQLRLGRRAGLGVTLTERG
ncbi:Aromatic dipeptide epimerase [bacterium HR17]|uniref:Dipeptide epimerase n=1 Tax=Candidatus Fervidibacter japonicus TaxID=2035412 RepID=A0A2H5XES4_9BACT|nr:Aromatic dipeptide epimerase [bacterium HR17]